MTNAEHPVMLAFRLLLVIFPGGCNLIATEKYGYGIYCRSSISEDNKNRCLLKIEVQLFLVNALTKLLLRFWRIFKIAFLVIHTVSDAQHGKLGATV